MTVFFQFARWRMFAQLQNFFFDFNSLWLNTLPLFLLRYLFLIKLLVLLSVHCLYLTVLYRVKRIVCCQTNQARHLLQILDTSSFLSLGSSLRYPQACSFASFRSGPRCYTTAHGNVRSLTHSARPGIKPVSSWILVRFTSTEP